MAMARRSVLFLHPADEGYGADRVLLLAATGLMERGWQVRVLLPDDVPAGWLSEQLGAIGIEVRRGPLAPARRRYFTLRGLPGYLAELVRARRFIRAAVHEWRPSVVHVNTTALLVAAVVGRPGRTKLVWHVHEIVVQPRILAMVFRLAPAAGADRVIAISEAVSSWILALPSQRRRVVRIYNGIDAGPSPTPRRSESLVVAFVGRLNRWKGVELLVEAAAMVAPAYPSVTFRIVGDPPQGEAWRRAALEEKTTRSGLRSVVRLEGYRSDIAELLSTVDIVVVPSRWPEPFGLVTAEAMRAGCAVVASNHGAASELLDNGRCGLLVRPNDAGHLAEALSRLLSDAKLRRRLGSAARKRVITAFGRERFLDDLVALYLDVTA